MRTWTAIALVVIGCGLVANPAAQPTEIVVVTNATSFAPATQPPPAGGPSLALITRANLRGLDGSVLGTANGLGVVAHPDLPYYPTVLELSNSAQTVVVAELASRDGAFRQTFAYNRVGPFGFYEASIARLDSTYVIRLAPARDTPVGSVTYGHTFKFQGERKVENFGTAALAFRPFSVWDLVVGPGVSTRFGDDFGIAGATAAFGYSLDYLRRPGGRSGAIVVCTSTPPVCGLAGVGEFDGYYGSAASRTPASFGLVADAASDTTIRSARPSYYRCPSAADPVRPRPFATSRSGRTSIQWNSIDCATDYVVRLALADGSVRFINSSTTGLTTILDVREISVAAVTSGGIGEYSETVVAQVLPPGL
jgi:hypothetical protein